MTDFRNNTSLPLGIRNNNPGNLRYVPSIKWKGQIGENKGFAVFDSVENGVRAMAIDLRTKIVTKKLNTLNKYIPIYAPPFENDTTAYINHVSRNTGIGANQAIDYSNDIFKLVKAHISIENGTAGKMVTDSIINAGLSNIGGGFTAKAAPVIGIFIILTLIAFLILKS